LLACPGEPLHRQKESEVKQKWLPCTRASMSPNCRRFRSPQVCQHQNFPVGGSRETQAPESHSAWPRSSWVKSFAQFRIFWRCFWANFSVSARRRVWGFGQSDTGQSEISRCVNGQRPGFAQGWARWGRKWNPCALHLSRPIHRSRHYV